VGSFLILAKSGPLLSSKSVASFFEKAASFQLSAISKRSSLLPFDFCPLPFALLPSLLPPLLPNGGFVPDSAKGRSFVIKQIGGFVFQKPLSFQPYF